MSNYEVIISDKVIDNSITVIKDNKENKLYVFPSEIGNVLDVNGAHVIHHYISKNEIKEGFHYKKFEGLELKELKGLLDPLPSRAKVELRTPSLNLLTDQGLYLMLMKSSSPKALPFQMKVCDILTQIRDKGFYIAPNIKKDQIELLYERVVKLRVGEKLDYKVLTHLFTFATDYDKNSIVAKYFFATIQNKIHYAVHNHTSAELIMERFDVTLTNYGLTTMDINGCSPENYMQVLTTGKNYLTEDELKYMDKLVNLILSAFEIRIRQNKESLTMQEIINLIDNMLRAVNCEVLQGKGTVSRTSIENHIKARLNELK